MVTDLANQYLSGVDAILNSGSFSGAAEHDLQMAYGELAEMTGWLHFDAGRFDHARYYLGESLRTAQLAGDLNLEVLVLASLNIVARYQSRAREALQVIQLAQRRAAGWASPRLAALLAARESVSWALLGDSNASDNAMRRARHNFTPEPTLDDPCWMSFFSEGELLVLQASASRYLGRDEQASKFLTSAVHSLGPKFQRNRAYYSVRLGRV